MQGFYIDCSILLKKKEANTLLSAVSPIPKLDESKGYKSGLVLLLDSKTVEKISIMKKKKRWKHILTRDFAKNIKGHCYIAYNPVTKICSICVENLPEILQAVHRGLPADVLIICTVALRDPNFSEKIKLLIDNNFGHPFIAQKTPVGELDSVSIAVLRLNNITEETDHNYVTNDVLYVLQEYKKRNDSCVLYARLTEKAITFLQNAPKVGVTINENGRHSQKEIAGQLYIKNIIKEDERLVFVIDLDKQSIKYGDEEEIYITPTRYNFHSHPKEAYIRNSVRKAWPSLMDFQAYISFDIIPIFHCVACLEGLYIISFKEYWSHHINEIDRGFIEKNFDLEYESSKTPQQWAEDTSKISLNNEPIFRVQFIPWDKLSSTLIYVTYPKIGPCCLSSDQTFAYFRKLYGL